MASDDASEVLGIVVFARHGDRQGFYQDPNTYTASSTTITPLGEQQEFQLGALLRALYLNASSPSFIQGITTGLFQQNQFQVRADAGGEGGVIFDSAVALTQGLFPPTALSNTTLANSSTITSPLGGYQYVPVESVEPNNDVSLEGYTSCNTFDQHTSAFYASAEFVAKKQEAAQFLNELKPYMDGRNVTLENMWNIFDYMNVQSIHDATFSKNLPEGYLARARDLANWHEYGVFTDNEILGIGNIAFRTMIPSVVTAIQRIANASDPLKLHYSSIAYKPFLSLFNMTGVVANGALPPAIVNYAASVVLEVRQPTRQPPSLLEPFIRFNFKNGTDDGTYRTYPMLIPNSDWSTGFDTTSSADSGSGSTDVPLSTFINALQPAAINSTQQWCGVCAQTEARGCAAFSTRTGGVTGASFRHDRISPVGAGFLGAGLTMVVYGLVTAALVFFGLLTVGRKARGAARPTFPENQGGSATNSITKEESV